MAKPMAAVAVEVAAGPRVGGLRAAIGARVFYGWVNVAAAACMVSQSEAEPMMMPTRACIRAL